MNIAVLVPVYNAEKTLRACLDALDAAGGRFVDSPVGVGGSFTICCRDDGSRDGSLALLNAFAAERRARGARVSLVVSSQPNAGVSKTRNALMDALPADCDAFAFCDSDDLVSPEIYEALATALVQNEADVAECGWWSADGTKKSAADRLQVVDDMSVYWLKRTSPGVWINVVNKLYRRSAAGAIRFRTGLAFEEDLFFNCEVNAAIRRKVLVPGLYYEYRDNAASATHALNFERYVSSTAERIRLSCETFLAPKRVPAALEGAYRAELVADAYRMVLRKNLKKNRDAASRRQLFEKASDLFAALERDFDFSAATLRFFPRLVYAACRHRRYAFANALARLHLA